MEINLPFFPSKESYDFEIEAEAMHKIAIRTEAIVGPQTHRHPLPYLVGHRYDPSMASAALS